MINLFALLNRLLPENQQNKENFFKNISSPQFQQALQSLSEVIIINNLNISLGFEF